MDNKRIQEITDFLYSSDETEDVPFRLCLSFGMFGGRDISKQELTMLLQWLSEGDISKEGAMDFLNSIGD